MRVVTFDRERGEIDLVGRGRIEVEDLED